MFGVQACDLTAIAYQDTFFRDDPYYQARRKQSLLVDVDCQAPCKNGFCATVNAGPYVSTENADLIPSNMSENKDSESLWLLIATTQKGIDSLKGLALENAAKRLRHLRSKIKEKVLDKFADFSCINNSIGHINDNLVPAELWEELSVRCLGCSGCTNLCPICSCYSSHEQLDVESNEQVTTRFWDSCLYEGFLREASGHNPSHLAGKRSERFWFHKFSDDYLPEFGLYGCVGCGRCEQTCPGSIGVHTVMKRINEVCCD